jgi:hypothetical protein
MPKDFIDYSNTIIYKIYCNDNNVSDIYIGHTTNFIKRKYQHKILCNNSKKLKIYDVIRENGGWENWSMIEIAKYKCQDATEARIREQEHYDLLKPTLNSVKPISDNEQIVTFIDSSILNNININNNDKTKKYYCEKCEYGCSKKYNWEKHLNTSKHTTTILSNEKMAKNNKKWQNGLFICENCEKEYKDRSGLWKHKKICNSKQETNSEKEEIVVNEPSNKELMMLLIKEHSELRKEQSNIKELILEMVKTSTVNASHNNNV